jgi:serine/threonine protein phosphatase PrpC
MALDRIAASASSGPAVTIGQHSEAGRKSSNDDSYGVVVPERALLETKGIAMAIADGMSSSEAAKAASEICVKSFLTDYFATHPSWTVKTSVGRVLTATNRWLHGQSEINYLSDRGMVSTFSGVVL